MDFLAMVCGFFGGVLGGILVALLRAPVKVENYGGNVENFVEMKDAEEEEDEEDESWRGNLDE